MHDASSAHDGGGRVREPDPPPPSTSRRGTRALRSTGALPLLALALALASAACRPGPVERDVTAAPPRPLREALAAHTPELMKLPGVVGTAESALDDGRPCILVLVARLTPALRKRIPETIEGWPVRVQETGEIRAMPDSAP